MKINPIITGNVIGVGVFLTAFLCWGGGNNRPAYKTSLNQASSSIQIEMERIAGGTFMMGSNAGSEFERPVHKVTISSFYIGKYEVTQSQWKAVMGSNPSWAKDQQKFGQYPVEQVSWNAIQIFIQKLNQMTGLRYRLPTEAEWEYACRAGASGDLLSEGVGANGRATEFPEVDAVAWSMNNSRSGTKAVGGKAPNAYGLYDMLGNVEEWCQDWYGEYSSEEQTNPSGPSTGSFRVTRGGSWINPYPWDVRASYRKPRDWTVPSYSNRDLGFRLARD